MTKSKGFWAAIAAGAAAIGFGIAMFFTGNQGAGIQSITKGIEIVAGAQDKQEADAPILHADEVPKDTTSREQGQK